MRNTKKLMSLLLALVMVFTLVACGNNKKVDTEKETTKESTKEESKKESKDEGKSGEALPYEGKTLKLAGLDGGYGVEGWKKVIEAFQAKTGAKVEATFEKNIEEVVRPLIQAGTAPDIMYISVGRKEALTETMLKEKAVLDVTDVLNKKILGEEKTVKEKLIPGMVDTFTTNPYGDGKTYLMPINYSPTGLFYNSALFKDGGGKLDLPTTVEEMKALKGKVEGASVFTYPTPGYFDQVFYGLVNSIGGSELFNKLMSYDVEAWKNQAKPVFEAMAAMIADTNPNTVAQATNDLYTQNQLSVMQNKSLFMPNGTWVVGEMADAKGVADGFKWGFMPLPAAKAGGDRYAYTFLEQVWVPATTKEPELAKEFLAFLYSDEAVKLFVDNGGAVMPVQNATSLISDEGQKLLYSVYDKGAKATLGGFQAAPAVEGVNLNAVLFDSLNSVVNGDMTVDQWHQAVVDAVTKINAAIKAQ